MRPGSGEVSRVSEATLRIEGLCGQPEKLADGARLVRDFQLPFMQLPFMAVSKQLFLCCSPFSRRSDAPGA
jgi:hypothetical protein